MNRAFAVFVLFAIFGGASAESRSIHAMTEITEPLPRYPVAHEPSYIVVYVTRGMLRLYRTNFMDSACQVRDAWERGNFGFAPVVARRVT